MKNVNFKKIASIVLAVTLVLSIIAPVPAAAAELKQAAEAELSVEQKLEEQKPEEQQPEEQKPEEQKPEEQKPEEEKPEEQKPEEEKPEEQKPEEEKPEEQKPEEQQPEEEKPEEQQPETEEPKRIEAGAMQADAERNALDENGGFYFTMDKNDIPLNEDVDENGNSLAWNNTFAPTADECIVVIRGEEEIRVGIPENAVLVKYSETGYYLKTASGEEKLLADALKPGDVIVIRGDFTNGNTTFTVAESLIFVGEDGSLTIEAVPESRVMTLANGAVVDLNTGSITTSAGNITIDAAGQKIGITFATDANDAPSGWNDAGMYKPTDANCIQIIRGGRTYSVANTGTYYIVKNGEQNAYMVTNVGSASKKSSDVLGTSAFYEFATADATATINLKAGGYKQVQAIIRGVETIIDIGDDDSFQLDIPANEGVFIIPIASDPSELGGAVAGAGAVDQNNYTAESARAFNEAYDAAQKVLKDTNANQNAIDAALKALDDAKNELEISSAPMRSWL